MSTTIKQLKDYPFRSTIKFGLDNFDFNYEDDYNHQTLHTKTSKQAAQIIEYRLKQMRDTIKIAPGPFPAFMHENDIIKYTKRIEENMIQLLTKAIADLNKDENEGFLVCYDSYYNYEEIGTFAVEIEIDRIYFDVEQEQLIEPTN